MYMYSTFMFNRLHFPTVLISYRRMMMVVVLMMMVMGVLIDY